MDFLAARYQLLAHLLQIPALWERGQLPQIRELLQTCSPTEHDFAWSYWSRLVNPRALSLRGSDRQINDADFSPDGNRVLMGYERSPAVVWDLLAQRPVAFFPARSQTRLDEHIVLPAGASDTRGEAISTMMKYSTAVEAVGFFAEGERVWTLEHGGELTVWDSRSGERLRSTKLGGSVEVGARSPDRRVVLVGDYNGDVSLVDLESGAVLQRFQGHAHCISALAWSADATTVAAGSWDHTVLVWEVATGKALLHVALPDRVESVALDALRHRLFATAEYQDRLYIWDLRTGEAISDPELTEGAREHLALSPQGDRLAVNVHRGTRLWNLVEARWEAELVPAGGRATFHPLGTSLIIKEHFQELGGLVGAQLRLPSFTSTKVLDEQSPNFHLDLVHAERLSPMVLSRDGKAVAVAASGEVQHRGKFGQRGYLLQAELVWGYQYDVATQERLFPIVGASAPATALAYSADDAYLAVGSREGSVFVFEAASGKRGARLEGLTGSITSVAISPNNTWVAACDQSHTYCVWAREAGVLFRTGLEGASAVAFSSDSAHLLLGTAEGVRTVEVITGNDGALLAGGSEPPRFLFVSPEGSYVLAGGVYEGLQLWEWATGTMKARLARQGLYLSSMAWGPEEQLVTGDNEGVVRVWDLTTASVTLELAASREPVALVGFADQGRTLVTGDSQGALRFWHG